MKYNIAVNGKIGAYKRLQITKEKFLTNLYMLWILFLFRSPLSVSHPCTSKWWVGEIQTIDSSAEKHWLPSLLNSLLVAPRSGVSALWPYSRRHQWCHWFDDTLYGSEHPHSSSRQYGLRGCRKSGRRFCVDSLYQSQLSHPTVFCCSMITIFIYINKTIKLIISTKFWMKSCFS